ncbi:MAG TPA: threonine--tRNA ligase [Thermoanaerobaculia bacterium]|jgi:threonyl-tRNA synthetase|nr:threonine--tRNA ligase [Thermoanaerobaculia bacterium]
MQTPIQTTIAEVVQLTLPDGSVREVPSGTTPLEVAASIGPRLAKDAVGAELDGRKVDLRLPLHRSGAFRIFTVKSPEAGDFVRHSAEHVLADAVKRLWPEVEIDAGRQDHSEKFQYDFRFSRAFTPEDLERIEEKMREILAEGSGFERAEVSRDEAERLFRDMGENLKVERLKDIPEGETITLYRHGRFVDLCRGPHAQSTKQIGAVKLLESSGVFWKGDENNEKLQRIYGTAFVTEKEMEEYLARQEMARARDHRRLGQELDLFSFSPLAPASPFLHPRGAAVYNGLIDYVRELYKRYGYSEVITPQILDVELWKTSGHWENYKDAMFFVDVDERLFAAKPMNCPTHCLIFATRLRSYRDLPIRYADFGRLHRYERSGVTNGLLRVRSFSQDDAHIFCTEEQIEGEVLAVAGMILEIYRTFGFERVDVEVSTRPEKRLGTDETWDRAEGALKAALDKQGIAYRINPGDGAFYGPKIDFHVYDALGRSWQLGTVQLDYQLPERFGLTYVGADGAEHRPVMIHRAMLGSLERFMAVLIEQTAGAFPLWLAPVQAVVLPVSEKFGEYAEQVRQRLAESGVRVELDSRNEKLGYKIREAQLQKVPYMLVVGAREQEEGTVSVRRRAGDDLGAMPVEAFLERVVSLSGSRSTEI